MLTITKAAKQIFNAVRNMPKSASASINSMVKYCSQSKGYIEDASEKFTFLKVLPSQSSKPSIQDKLKAFNPNLQNLENLKSTPLLDSAEIRKLIYARFADEIASKPSDTEENQYLETKHHATREHVETFTTYNIADEFNDLRNQGYDFASARKAIENQNVRSLSDRMKGLVVAGYISNYGGESGLKEEVEEVMHQKALVIEEFMQRLAGELEVHSSELLG